MPNPSELTRDAEAAPLTPEQEEQVRDAVGYGHDLKHFGARALLAALDGVRAERDRLREALTWAVGFIDCNFPPTRRDYPDMRNALDLVRVNRLDFGPFQTALARAELAEEERDRLRADLAEALEWIATKRAERPG